MQKRATYDNLGRGYSSVRREDPRIFSQILKALGNASSVANIGAGAGSYEPRDRDVLAIEPSKEMISQRPGDAAKVIQGYAERIPLRDASCDASMAVLTIHHWSHLREGLKEMRRITRDRVVIFSFDPKQCDFWLTQDYFPDLLAQDRKRFPDASTIARMLGCPVVEEPVPIPHDCADGFVAAYWRRPRAYLDPKIREGMSAFRQRDHDSIRYGLGALQRDLDSGAWETKFGKLLEKDSLDLGYRLYVCDLKKQPPK